MVRRRFANAVKLSRIMPHATLHSIRNGGHFILLERSLEVCGLHVHGVSQ